MDVAKSQGVHKTLVSFAITVTGMISITYVFAAPDYNLFLTFLYFKILCQLHADILREVLSLRPLPPPLKKKVREKQRLIVCNSSNFAQHANPPTSKAHDSRCPGIRFQSWKELKIRKSEISLADVDRRSAKVLTDRNEKTRDPEFLFKNTLICLV